MEDRVALCACLCQPLLREQQLADLDGVERGTLHQLVAHGPEAKSRIAQMCNSHLQELI